MLSLQNLYHAVLLKQQSATNGETLTSDALDTKGYREVLFVLHGTTSNNATNNMSVLKVQQSDTTDATNYGDVTGYVGDTSFTIPADVTATTTAPKAVLHLGYGKWTKRYLRVLLTPVTTQTFSLTAAMARAEEAPNSITEQNVAVAVNGE